MVSKYLPLIPIIAISFLYFTDYHQVKTWTKLHLVQENRLIDFLYDLPFRFYTSIFMDNNNNNKGVNNNNSNNNNKKRNERKKEEESTRIFTEEELSKYDNLQLGLYLAILGHVFDVGKGEKHYGPGETYHPFVGRDASLAFVTGSFTKKDLIDDTSSLTPRQMKSLDNWLKFYKENYVYKGKLKGRYFDANGNPTGDYFMVKSKIQKAKEEDSNEEQLKRMFPPCNIEWKPETGSRVWCSKRSGGFQRDWVGVPRMFYDTPGSNDHRCACVQLQSREFQENAGRFREYIGCEESSSSCFIKAIEKNK